jgi:hypothetical protein
MGAEIKNPHLPVPSVVESNFCGPLVGRITERLRHGGALTMAFEVRLLDSWGSRRSNGTRSSRTGTTRRSIHSSARTRRRFSLSSGLGAPRSVTRIRRGLCAQVAHTIRGRHPVFPKAKRGGTSTCRHGPGTSLARVPGRLPSACYAARRHPQLAPQVSFSQPASSSSRSMVGRTATRGRPGRNRPGCQDPGSTDMARERALGPSSRKAFLARLSKSCSALAHSRPSVISSTREPFGWLKTET